MFRSLNIVKTDSDIISGVINRTMSMFTPFRLLPRFSVLFRPRPGKKKSTPVTSDVKPVLVKLYSRETTTKMSQGAEALRMVKFS